MFFFAIAAAWLSEVIHSFDEEEKEEEEEEEEAGIVPFDRLPGIPA